MNATLRFLTFAGLVGATAIPSFAGTGDSSARTLWIQLDPVAVSAKAPFAKPFAESSTLDAKTRTLRLVVKPNLSLDDVATRLSRRREVSQIRSKERVLFTATKDMRSVTGIKTFILNLGGEIEERRKFSIKNEEEEAGPDYLRGLLDYVKVRAYPYDRIDAEAYNRAVEQARRLPPAKIGQGAGTRPNSGVMGGLAAGISGKWKYVGPNNLNTPYRVYFGLRPSSGRVSAIAYDPVNTNIIYAGAPHGGVMKTTDGGKTWTAIGENWGFNTVSCIVVDPRNPNTLYVGTGDFHGLLGAYTMGIMKSTDGGASWTNLGRSNFGSTAVSSIVIDPSNSNVLVVATGRGPDGAGRVWRSANGGQTFTPVINTLAAWSSLSYTAPDGSGNRLLFAAGSNGNLYRSSDFGTTWTKITAPGGSNDFFVPCIAGSAVDSRTAYFMNTAEQKIYKSTDSGANWNDITGSFPGGYNWSQAYYDWYLACFKNGTRDHLFAGLIDVVESPDGGSTWQSVGVTYTEGAKTHNDQHSFAVNPQNPNEVMLGNDGGIYRAVGGAGKWVITGLNETLGITQFYNVAFHPTDRTRMIGGTQDNATPVSLGNLARWENVGGGDGGFCAISPQNPDIQFATIYNFTVLMTRNNWATTTDISPNIGTDRSPFVTPIYINPVNPRYLYGGTNYLWRYDIQAGTWTARLGNTPLSNGSLVRAVAVAPTNGDVIYTGSDDGRLFMSTNGGTSWRNLNVASLPNRAITSISVSRSNPFEILVCLSGTGTQHVWQCNNTNANPPVFTSRSGSGAKALPDVPVNSIDRDPFKPQTTWYVGTDIGLFSTGDGGITWENATAPLGLPNVQINTVHANGATGLLHVGTFGRGVWSINFGQAAPLKPSAFSILTGVLSGGTLSSLAADDGSNLIVTSKSMGSLGQVAAEVSTFTVPGTGALLNLEFEVSALTSVNTATVQIYVKNWRTGQHEIMKSFAGTLARTTNKISVTGNVSDYMSSGRKLELVVRALVPPRFGTKTFRLSIDRTSAVATTND